MSALPKSELPGPEIGRHDALPCDVSVDDHVTFRKGEPLGTLLDYLARRVTENNREALS